jgi:hypothetical protein
MEEPPSKGIKLNNEIEIVIEISKNQNEVPKIALDDFFVRFSHLTEQIFDQLNRTSLAECREVGKSWQIYLDQQKILQVKIIRTSLFQHGDYDTSWQRILTKSNTKMIFELRTMLKNAYDFLLEKKFKMSLTPLHVAAINGELSAYQYFLGKIRYINPRNAYGLTPDLLTTPLHLAAYIGHLNLCLYIMDIIDVKLPRDQAGFSPLHLAALRGNLNIC